MWELLTIAVVVVALVMAVFLLRRRWDWTSRFVTVGTYLALSLAWHRPSDEMLVLAIALGLVHWFLAELSDAYVACVIV